MTSKKDALVKLYNIVVFVLCIISVGLSIKDFTSGLTSTQTTMDMIIYFLFVADYIVRLLISGDKVAFFKDSIFDLLAIMPFNSAFRAFRMFRMVRAMRFTRLFKFTKLFRVGSLSGRLISRAKRFLDTNGFKYVLLLCGSSILLASFAMMHFEKMSFHDALWWSFVTATTVGYGDLSPATGSGRIIAALLMLTGIGLIGSLTSTITSFFLHSDQAEVSSEKVEMVIALYERLSPLEQKEFMHMIGGENENRSKEAKHQESCEVEDYRQNETSR